MPRLIAWFKWILKGKPMIHYKGFHCGCCGSWTWLDFSVPQYKSDDFYDTWGLCDNCKGGSNG